nr:IS110 family transposase [Aeromicrobium sp.]
MPRAGSVRAARLLAEIGDSRARLPTPESLACLAGVAPSTRASGKGRQVGSRWACNQQLRDAVCDFTGDSRRANPWAEDIYQQACNRGHDHAHSVRILAPAWLYVIWHCWQDKTAYEPARHHALQRLLADRNVINKQLDTGLLTRWPLNVRDRHEPGHDRWPELHHLMGFARRA